MNILDISWPVTPDITEYKDRKTVSFKSLKEFKSDGVRETQICFHSHTGTHIDAPSHFMQNGASIDSIGLQRLVRTCKVIDLTHIQEKITADDLRHCAIEKYDTILLKTRNSNHEACAPFEYDFVYLDASGAQYLVDKHVNAVGIDYLGIERKQPAHETHTLLLGHDIIIIEGLRLAKAAPGDYMLYCLPLHVVGIDAAPARAVLMPCD